MKKKVYILEPTHEALNACAEIINRIPCFSLREYSPAVRPLSSPLSAENRTCRSWNGCSPPMYKMGSHKGSLSCAPGTKGILKV